VSTFVQSVVRDAEAIQQRLMSDPTLDGLIGSRAAIPRPYIGTGQVRLVIVGQDPTVKRKESRSTISTVLNLDRGGALRVFLKRLCGDLGIELDENVYATNFAKGFFADPPTTLHERTGRDVLAETAAAWLPLLRRELDAYPEAAVISLGEPVLRVLIRPGHPQAMRHYWGWRRNWKTRGARPFVSLDSNATRLDRAFFPFVHQPTMRGSRTEFYRVRWADYTAFIKAESGL